MSIGVRIWLWRELGAEWRPVPPRLYHPGAQEVELAAAAPGQMPEAVMRSAWRWL